MYWLLCNLLGWIGPFTSENAAQAEYRERQDEMKTCSMWTGTRMAADKFKFTIK